MFKQHAMQGLFVLSWNKHRFFNLCEKCFYCTINTCNYLVFRKYDIFCLPKNQFIIQGQFKAVLLFVGYLNAVGINWSRHVYQLLMYVYNTVNRRGLIRLCLWRLQSIQFLTKTFCWTSGCAVLILKFNELDEFV